MPFKSEKQRRYLWSQHPRIAEAWSHGRSSVTGTMSNGTGTQSSRLEVDIFSLPVGFAATGIDLVGSTETASSVSTFSFSPGSGSSHSSNTDELAFTALYSGLNANGGITGTNTFTGTSAAANLAIAETANDAILACQYVGGVQASATAGSNTWVNTWTTARGSCAILGATFYYSASATAGLLPALTLIGT